MLSEFTALTVVVMLVIKSISLESESDTRVSSDISICLTEPCGLCGLSICGALSQNGCGLRS